jgi:hypothetical protein
MQYLSPFRLYAVSPLSDFTEYAPFPTL